MQSAVRRVRSIYSVVASPNRLEILRIINTKGPLTYSELKALAGFKSKKESGKFAYHLRKLVRHALISLNRMERKYNITNLGRLVLNLTRKIEEQAVMESGKLYVRTSRQTMEEFNSDKIVQSLVREAGVPVELAQRVAAETEARLYKFQTLYLTAPLIREMANALLIEQGLEEFRHRLTRLGLPVYDVSQLMKSDLAQEGFHALASYTAEAVFSEYLLLTQLPRDIADAHLSGDIHVSHAGSWGVLPDTLFIDLLVFNENGIKLPGRMASLPVLKAASSLEEAAINLSILSRVLSNECTTELCFTNFLPYFAKYGASEDIEGYRRVIEKLFILASGSTTFQTMPPAISIVLDGNGRGKNDSEELLLATLSAYQNFLGRVSVPQLKLILHGQSMSKDVANGLASALQSYGSIALCQREGLSAYSGLRRDFGEQEASVFLHTLAVNLPRLAYESNRDETYFRAKLAMMIQLSMSALSTRRSIIKEMIKQGALPLISRNPYLFPTDIMPLAVNLTGMGEALDIILGDRASSATKNSLVDKIVDTSVKIAKEVASKTSESGGVQIIHDESAARFMRMDSEKYGKIFPHKRTVTGYSQPPILDALSLLNGDAMESAKPYSMLNAGHAITISFPDELSNKEIAETIAKAKDGIDFFKLAKTVNICRKCGSRVPTTSNICKECRSSSLTPYMTI